MNVVLVCEGDMEFEKFDEGNGMLNFMGGRLYLNKEAAATVPAGGIKRIELAGQMKAAEKPFEVCFKPSGVLKMVPAGK